MSKKKKKSGKYSSISSHNRHKSKLIAPINKLPMEVLNWERDFLPEHIWLECLSSTYPENIWLGLYNGFLDELDKYFPERIIMYGFITDFGLIPQDKREEFIKNNEQLIYDVFYKPFGRIIAFYPESPCYWLLQEKHLEEEGPLDPTIELRKLTECVLRLLPGKDLYAGHLRAVPLNRAFKYDRIRLSQKLKVIDLLPKYPIECSDDEKYRVQQFARMTMNIQYQQIEHYKGREWPKYFWRHNFDIVPCIPRYINLKKFTSLSDTDIKLVYEIIEKNANTAIDYLNEVTIKHRYDLYNPERDEILLGLFSRLTRLHILISLSPNLWPRDVAGIMLRCLVETAITFAYLSKVGTEKEFEEFRSYGEGKEKLLLLHLQDTYPEKKTLEGRSAEDIASELGGGFTPELINIELGYWTKKSIRDLAIDAKVEDLYRLVYDPTSSDVHGTWISVKNSNLVKCAQPLHRFHRMPQYFEPPAFINTIDAVQRIYLKCVDIGIRVLQFPGMKIPLEEVSAFPRENDGNK